MAVGATWNGSRFQEAVELSVNAGVDMIWQTGNITGTL